MSCHNSVQVIFYFAAVLLLAVQPSDLCTAQPTFLVQNQILGLPEQAKVSQVLLQMLVPVLKGLKILA